MKYLTIIENLEYRGSQRVAQNYSIGMKNLGHEVKVLTISGLGRRADYLSNEGIESFCLNVDQNWLKQILDWSPDVVHVHRPGMYDKNINPIIIDLKNSINPLILETNIFSRVDYQIPSGYIDLHLHLTEWCLWKWLEWSKVLNYNPLGTVLPNSLISDNFYRSSPVDIAAKKQEIGIPKDDFVFGRVGANCEGKWHPIIIDAFEELAKQQYNISLLLVAPPVSIEDKVKNLTANIRKKVFIVEPILNADDNQLRLLYSTMDVMVHASRIGESFGIVLAESLLCETPVITLSSPTKDNSQTEIIEHNKTGKVVNNYKGFVDAMTELLHNQKQLSTMGKDGRKQIIDKFDNQYVSRRLELLCNSFLACRNQVDNQIKILKEYNFPTKISQNQIFQKLNSFNGTVSVYDKLMTQLVHQPALYRFYTNSILTLKHAYFARIRH